MTQDRDPGFAYHEKMAQVLALLVLEVADRADMPFNMTSYGARALGWYDELAQFVAEEQGKKRDGHGGKGLDLKPLKEAVEFMMKNMIEFDAKPVEWDGGAAGAGGDGFVDVETEVKAVHRISHNARMANFEAHLLEDEGVWGRGWWKHVLMAPKVSTRNLSSLYTANWCLQRDNGHEPEYFPSIRDAVEDGEWVIAQEFVGKVADRVRRASDKILN